MLHDKLKPFHRFLIALVSSLIAVLITFLLISFRDLKFYALITVGVAVFVYVLFLLFVNRYRLMAHSVLGALIAYGYLSNSLNLSLVVSDNVFLNFIFDGSSWIEPFSLTVCFIALLFFDYIDRHPDILHGNNKSCSMPMNFKEVQARDISISNVPNQVIINSGISKEILDHLLDREFEKGQTCALSGIVVLQGDNSRSTEKDTSPIVAELMSILHKCEVYIDSGAFKKAIELRDNILHILSLNENLLDNDILKYFFTELADIEIKIVQYNHIHNNLPEDYSNVEKYIQKARYYE